MAVIRDIQTTLNFNDDDLSSNRAGEMSPRQQAQFKRQSRFGTLAMMAFFGIFFVSTLFATIAFSTFTSFGAIIWGIFCFIFGVILLGLLRNLLFLSVPSVKHVSGHMVRGNPTRSRDLYEVEINGQPFKLSQAIIGLMNSETTYTFHFTDNNSVPISIEEASKFAVGSEKSPEVITQEKFQQLYQFTPSDLAVNRLGQMSTAQQEQRRAAAKDSTGCLLLSVPIALFPAIFVISFTQNLALTAATAAGMYMLMMLLTFNSRRSQLKALENVQVLRVAGVVDASIGSHRSGGKHPHTVTDYYVSLGGMRFRLPESQYYAFKEGASYAIYYSTLNDFPTILSAEDIQAARR